MANKKEKIMAWEINQMADKIRPLNGIGSATQTASMVGNSWVMHEPLFKCLQSAIFCQSMIVHFNSETEQHDRNYYEGEYEKAVAGFWEYNSEAFNEPLVKRPKY